MTGAHGDVGHPEVEERLTCIRVVHANETRNVVVEGGLQRAVQQVLHREVFGVVAPRRLAGTGTIVKIDLADSYGRVVSRTCRDVNRLILLLLENEIDVGDCQLGFQQTLIDGAELAHPE